MGDGDGKRKAGANFGLTHQIQTVARSVYGFYGHNLRVHQREMVAHQVEERVQARVVGAVAVGAAEDQVLFCYLQT